jgi:hypothetical protein
MRKAQKRRGRQRPALPIGASFTRFPLSGLPRMPLRPTELSGQLPAHAPAGQRMQEIARPVKGPGRDTCLTQQVLLLQRLTQAHDAGFQA